MFCPRCGEQVDTSNRYCPRCGEDLTQVTGASKAGATVPLAAQPPQENEDVLVADALKEEYEIEKELGRGGMAVVYKARDKQLEREVAIKVLPFSLSFDAEFVERFQREARTAGKLEHPNIIPIYRVGRSGRVIYFVMKFIRGKSLSGVIESRGALPVPEIKRMLIECARALGYAHKHGIVHRDIKPDNIMFDELGQAIVTDFGIAKAQSGARLTGTGMSIGTPHYMSPEQARAQNLDGRSDIYSLGVVGYQCLTGHVPFDGEDSFSIGYKHIMEELPVPALEQADQRDLFSVVQKMLAKKAEDRFQAAEEMIAALEAGSPMSLADMSTMPTRAIEPMKAPPPPPKKPTPAPPAGLAQPTTPLPRASASMPKPKEPAAAPPPAAREPPRPAPPKRPPPPRAVEKKGGAGLVFALIGAIVVVGGGAGYYFGVMKPAQQRQQLALRDTTARAESLSTLAGADSTSRDTSRAPADTARPQPSGAAKSEPAGTAKREPTGIAKRETRPTPTTTTPVPAAREGTIRLGGSIPAGARVTLNGEQKAGPEIRVPAGSYTLRIEAQGYRPFEQRITVAAGGLRPVKVQMPTTTAAATGQPSGQPATQPAGQPVTQPAGQPATQPAGTAAATPPPAACTTNPTMSVLNARRACWDVRPTPRTPTLLAPPASCSGRITPANILVQVSPQGEVVGNPSVQKASNCPAFTAQAQAQAMDLTFVPATKNGQPVVAWAIVPFRSTR
jgi:serine/threonine protein kinase